MWDVKNEKTGTLVTILFIMVFLWATQISPMMAVAIIEDRGDWQWTYWLTAIILGILIVLVF